jgi:hypothetical protein
VTTKKTAIKAASSERVARSKRYSRNSGIV